ncbi:unnamed protein product [Prunus armeniaca]
MGETAEISVESLVPLFLFGKRGYSFRSRPDIGVMSGIPQDSSWVSKNLGRVLSGPFPKQALGRDSPARDTADIPCRIQCLPQQSHRKLGLCGDPLPKKCGNAETPQLSPSSREENNSGSRIGFDWKFVLARIESGLLVGVVPADNVITRGKELFIEIVEMIR